MCLRDTERKTADSSRWLLSCLPVGAGALHAVQASLVGAGTQSQLPCGSGLAGSSSQSQSQAFKMQMSSAASLSMLALHHQV